MNSVHGITLFSIAPARINQRGAKFK